MNVNFFLLILLRKSAYKLLSMLAVIAFLLAFLPLTPASAVPFTLTVTNNGTGSGTVTSSPLGINCSLTCSASFSSAVVLTAAAATGSIFTGWSGGGCSGTGTCSLPIMSADTSVSATFTAITYTISGYAGVGGANLSYSDPNPIPQMVTADSSGNYTLTVSYNWSGTVTPSKAGYYFTPVNTAYTNVLANSINQNYAASLSGHSATTYYVDNTISCSDSNNGLTLTTPFCTINRGAAVAIAGNTVRVLHGTYPEKVKPDSNGGPGYSITFSADPGVTVTGDGIVGTGSAFRLTSWSYITIDGFNVTGTIDHGIYAYNSDHITISHNHVTLSGSPSVGNERVGIYIYGTTNSTIDSNTTDHNSSHGIQLSFSSNNNTVSNNTSFANATVFTKDATGITVFSNSDNNTIIHNVTYANEDTGLNFYTGAHDNFIIGNLSYGNGDHGIDDNAAPNNTIVGNTVQGNVTVGINLEGDSASGSGGATVMNNISVDNGLNPPTGLPGNIRVDAQSLSGTTLDYNIVFHHGNYPGSPVLITWGTTNYTNLSTFQGFNPTQEIHGSQVDPLWISAAPPASRPPSVVVGDYHLSAGSPAIDSANSNAPNEPALDIEGNPRVDDPNTTNTGSGTRLYDDRGAYEFQAPVCYTLSITSGTNGSTPTASSTKSAECYITGQYVQGALINFTAVPAPLYQVASWSGTNNDASTLTTNTVTMPASVRTVGVIYTPIVYTLTITSAHGTVNRNNPGPYHYGDVVQLTPVPAAGWSFANWTGDASGTANPVSITMDGNKTVTANYTNKITPTLTVSGGPFTYDGASHAATVTHSVPGVVSNIKYNGSATATNAGTYTVTADFTPTDTTNYNSLTGALGGSMTVNKAAQVINVTSHAPTEAANNTNFDVAASGGGSGNPVVITSMGVCTGGGNNSATITMSGSEGTCTVRYNQAGDSNYNSATEVTEIASTITFVISGNAGVGGAVLSYNDGGTQTVTADDNGNYLINVSYNWSGTVTPSKAGYTFSLASHTYNNILSNQTDQNFTANLSSYRINMPIVIH